MIQGIAEESFKIKKFRSKLEKRLGDMDQEITTQALKRKSSEIERWIARHVEGRIVFQDKSFSLYDGNHKTADFSQKINAILEKLKRQAT